MALDDVITLTKARIVQTIHREAGIPKENAAKIIETLLKIMKGKMAKGESILISGFGKFCVRKKEERRGRNPATSQDMMLPERKVVTFKCSSILKKKLN